MFISGVWPLAPCFKSVIPPPPPPCLLIIRDTAICQRVKPRGTQPCPHILFKASANVGVVAMECTTLWTSMGVNSEPVDGGRIGDDETKMTKLVRDQA